MRILARGDLERLLPPLDVVAALEAAITLHAEGKTASPPRAVTPLGHEGLLLTMPALLGGLDTRLGTKLVTVYPGNRARGHPTIYASYVLMDGATGQPLALLEGSFLTGLRTGAVSALAATRLARPEASRIACFGAGVQAGFQLICLAAVRALRHVAVVGRDPQHAMQFATAMRGRLGASVEVVSDAKSAVANADIITCATTSSTPVLFGADIRPGTHVDLVGAFRPTDREADTALMRRARVVVDTYEGALAEAGDVLIPISEGAFGRDHITADLIALVTKPGSGRASPEEITVFKSVGWALEDLATASLAYNRAQRQGIGTEVTW